MLLIYQKLLLKRKEFLEQEILNLQEKISLLPPWKLICTRNGNYFKWYHRTTTSFSYLPKSKQNLAELLALKKYYAFQLEHLKAEIETLNLYLSKFQSSSSSAFEFLNQHPEYQKLLQKTVESSSPIFSKELNDWVSDTYETNSMHPEQLSHLSISGHILRSKSEVIIDTALFSNRIPFRYECALSLGFKTNSFLISLSQVTFYVPNLKLSLILHCSPIVFPFATNVHFLLVSKHFSLTSPYVIRKPKISSTGSILE